MNKRGTRPTTRQSWPRTAERERLEGFDIGAELVRLAHLAEREEGNKYAQKVFRVEVRALGERLQRLMLQASIGIDPAE